MDPQRDRDLSLRLEKERGEMPPAKNGTSRGQRKRVGGRRLVVLGGYGAEVASGEQFFGIWDARKL